MSSKQLLCSGCRGQRAKLGVRVEHLGPHSHLVTCTPVTPMETLLHFTETTAAIWMSIISTARDYKTNSRHACGPDEHPSSASERLTGGRAQVGHPEVGGTQRGCGSSTQPLPPPAHLPAVEGPRGSG